MLLIVLWRPNGCFITLSYNRLYLQDTLCSCLNRSSLRRSKDSHMELITGWRAGMCVMWSDISLPVVRYYLSLSFVIKYISNIAHVTTVSIDAHCQPHHRKENYFPYYSNATLNELWAVINPKPHKTCHQIDFCPLGPSFPFI